MLTACQPASVIAESCYCGNGAAKSSCENGQVCFVSEADGTGNCLDLCQPTSGRPLVSACACASYDMDVIVECSYQAFCVREPANAVCLFSCVAERAAFRTQIRSISESRIYYQNAYVEDLCAANYMTAPPGCVCSLADAQLCGIDTRIYSACTIDESGAAHCLGLCKPNLVLEATCACYTGENTAVYCPIGSVCVKTGSGSSSVNICLPVCAEYGNYNTACACASAYYKSPALYCPAKGACYRDYQGVFTVFNKACSLTTIATEQCHCWQPGVDAGRTCNVGYACSYGMCYNPCTGASMVAYPTTCACTWKDDDVTRFTMCEKHKSCGIRGAIVTPYCEKNTFLGFPCTCEGQVCYQGQVCADSNHGGCVAANCVTNRINAFSCLCYNEKTQSYFEICEPNYPCVLDSKNAITCMPICNTSGDNEEECACPTSKLGIDVTICKHPNVCAMASDHKQLCMPKCEYDTPLKANCSCYTPDQVSNQAMQCHTGYMCTYYNSYFMQCVDICQEAVVPYPVHCMYLDANKKYYYCAAGDVCTTQIQGLVCHEACKKCTVSDDNTKCLGCTKGYGLEYTNSTTCKPCQTFCLRCEEDFAQCTQCEYGYKLDNYQCTAYTTQLMFEVANITISCVLLVFVVACVILLLLYARIRHKRSLIDDMLHPMYEIKYVNAQMQQ